MWVADVHSEVEAVKSRCTTSLVTLRHLSLMALEQIKC